jgi:hypothetical protein
MMGMRWLGRAGVKPGAALPATVGIGCLPPEWLPSVLTGCVYANSRWAAAVFGSNGI